MTAGKTRDTSSDSWEFYPRLQDLDSVSIEPDIGAGLPRSFLMRHRLLPLQRRADGSILTAAADTGDIPALDALAAALDAPLDIVCVPADIIEATLLRLAEQTRETAETILAEDADASDAGEKDTYMEDILVSDPEHPLIIRLVNTLIAEAEARNASDIHLEPEKDRLRVRFRIDGVLSDGTHSPAHLRDMVISRIKVMARLDIAQRLKPQDGRFSVIVGGKPMDIRVSCVPTPFGERLVLRLLEHRRQQMTLESLGMPEHAVRLVDRILAQPQGLFIAAGPTGSGKTTTLYAALKRIDTTGRNTMTIEDPVEYDLPGISQVHAGGPFAMGFADGLRSLLRQDPDIIMVGEIRDGETASIALRAALTGHLILTTIHTINPAAAIIRLMDLGTDPTLIAETLSAVMDQRLIRLLCTECAVTDPQSGLREPGGCPSCAHTGFAGRVGLFRTLTVDDALRRAIRSRNYGEVKALAAQECKGQLRQAAERLVRECRTSRSEMHRVLQGDDLA